MNPMPLKDALALIQRVVDHYPPTATARVDMDMGEQLAPQQPDPEYKTWVWNGNCTITLRIEGPIKEMPCSR